MSRSGPEAEAAATAAAEEEEEEEEESNNKSYKRKLKIQQRRRSSQKKKKNNITSCRDVRKGRRMDNKSISQPMKNKKTVTLLLPSCGQSDTTRLI